MEEEEEEEAEEAAVAERRPGENLSTAQVADAPERAAQRGQAAVLPGAADAREVSARLRWEWQKRRQRQAWAWVCAAP